MMVVLLVLLSSAKVFNLTNNSSNSKLKDIFLQKYKSEANTQVQVLEAMKCDV